MDKKTPQPEQPVRVLQPADVAIEDQNRTVTFAQRPDQFALHPAVVTLPWAVLKLVTAEILKHESNVELARMGGNVNTKVVTPAKGPGTPQ